MGIIKLLYNYSGTLLATASIPVFIIYFLFLIAGYQDEQIAGFIQHPLFSIAIGTAIIVLPVILTIYFRSYNTPQLQSYLNISVLRYVVAFLLFYYGFSKMSGKFFEITYAAQDTRLGDVDTFALTWFYFGKSNTQEFIIGLFELIPALLLLFRPTFLLATLLLLPVVLNILMINIFNDIAGITRVVSFFITLSVIYFLTGRLPQIISFLRHTIVHQKNELSKGLNLVGIIAKTFVIGSILFVFIAMIFSNSSSKKLSAARNKITGGFELDSLSIDNKEINLRYTEADFYKTIYLEPQARWNSVLMISDVRLSKPFKVNWHKSDSVTTFLKKRNDVADNTVDSSSKFTGIYSCKSGKLYVDGIQHHSNIHAVYVKKNLKEYNWFW